MASRPPRVTSTRRQRTTRGGPVVTSRYPQATTGRGRVVRPPSLPQVLAPSWGRAVRAPAAPSAALAAGPAASTLQAPQYSLSNLPPDADYLSQLGALQKQRDEALAAIAGERTRTLGDYGFQEGPNGLLTYDPNNPMSKASQLKKAYDTNRRSTAQTMGAGGQLYSGAFQNAQDLVNRNQLTAEDAQQKALAAFLAGNTGRTKEAQTGYEFAAAQADAERTARFQSNPLYDPASGTWKDPDTGAATAAPAAPSAAAPSSPASLAAAMRRRQRMTGARLGRI